MKPGVLQWLPAREMRKSQQRGWRRGWGGGGRARQAWGLRRQGGNCIQEGGELQEEGAAASAAERPGRHGLRNSHRI